MISKTKTSWFSTKVEVLDRNEKHYPNLPDVLYIHGDEIKAAQIFMGLDASMKKEICMSQEEIRKSWLAFAIRVTTPDDKVTEFRWR